MWRLVLAFPILLTAACGPRADAATVVQVFLSSRDVRDIDSAMSVVAPNATMRAPNELQYSGGEQIRRWLETTLNDYSFELTQAPQASGTHVSWRDNLYSNTGKRWVGEIAWDVSVTGIEISSIDGRVVRGASGVICPSCPPGTKI